MTAKKTVRSKAKASDDDEYTVEAIGNVPRAERERRRSVAYKRATLMRAEWTQLIASGEKTVREALRKSNDDRYAPIKKIRLLAILSNAPGWGKQSALNALTVQLGCAEQTQLWNIARNVKKLNEFQDLLGTSGENYSPRPRLPKGWPFEGKLDDLLNDETILREQERALFGSEPTIIGGKHDPGLADVGDEDDETGTEESDGEADLDDFLSEDDEDDEDDAEDDGTSAVLDDFLS